MRIKRLSILLAILVALIVVLIIAGYSVTGSSLSPDEIREKVTIARIKNDILPAIKSYKKDVNDLFHVQQNIINLCSNNDNIVGWSGPYLRDNSLMLDYWDTLFIITQRNDRVYVVSGGIDKKFGTADDITVAIGNQ